MEQRRRVRKVVTRAVIFLLLGVVVNVAVAWGLKVAYRGSDTGVSETFAGYQVTQFRCISRCIVYVDRFDDYDPNESKEAFEALIPRWAKEFLYIPELEGRNSRDVLMDPAWDFRIVDGHGWPCLSFWWGISGSFNRLDSQVHGAIYLEEVAERLPYLPIWPGFAINTIFYAVILWLLSLMPSWLRRRHRIKRGLCIACGYDLRASKDNCPECGAAIPSESAGVVDPGEPENLSTLAY